jgi:MarR family transcriptional regulator, organic hydroperoxide resistance regulator
MLAKMDHTLPESDSDAPAAEAPRLPLDRSVGYQIRVTHRLIQRALQAKVEQHGVTLGMWYFLRVLWEEDGITQSELSQRVGTMEPTTLSAIRDMERNGFVERVPNEADRRKINIYLTERGRALQQQLLPSGIEVVESAVRGMTDREVTMLLSLLSCMQRNLQE